jgi:hypothetical protein
VAGDSVYLIGRNFADQQTMMCQFGSTLVQAAYINASVVECRTPIAASGTLEVFVTNDLERFSNGFHFGVKAFTASDDRVLNVAGAGIVWPGHTGPTRSVVPRDYDGSVVPAELTIALLFTSAWRTGAIAATELAVAAARGSGLLPFTNLTWRYYDVTAALDTSLTVPVLQSTMRAIRAEIGGSFVGVVGPAESFLCIALANLSAHSPAPWPIVSPGASSVALSLHSNFPTFLRMTGSDAVRCAALAAALQQLLPALLQRGLVDEQRMSIILILSDDAEYAGLVSAFETALRSTELTISARVLLPVAAELGLIATLAAPVCASDDKTLVVLTPSSTTADLLLQCSLNSTRFARTCRECGAPADIVT